MQASWLDLHVQSTVHRKCGLCAVWQCGKPYVYVSRIFPAYCMPTHTRVSFDLFLLLIFDERYSWLCLSLYRFFSTPLTLLLGPNNLHSILLSHVSHLSSYLNVRDSFSQSCSREGLGLRLAVAVQFLLYLRPAFHVITTVTRLA